MNVLKTCYRVMQYIQKEDKRAILGLKFGLKVGIAASACYYLAEEGIWKESSESTKIYAKINDVVKPLVKDIPIEIPDLPKTSCLSYMAKKYWNNGVTTSFEFLGNLPQHISTWTGQGYNAVSNNPEVKKFFSSLSPPPPPPPPEDESKPKPAKTIEKSGKD